MPHALSVADSESSVSTQPAMADLPAFAEVIVPRHLNRSFTYAIPDQLRDRLQVGSRVRIPFGPSMLQGVVVSLTAQGSHGGEQELATSGRVAGRLREIASVIDETPETGLPPGLLTLTRLVSERYLAPWGQCVRLILPTLPASRHLPRYFITEAGRKRQESAGRLASTACQILARLAGAPQGLTVASLRRAVSGPVARTVRTLTRRKWVREIEPNRRGDQDNQTERRRSTASDMTPASSPSQVQRPQESAVVPSPAPAWWDHLRRALDRAEPRAFLLQAPSAQRLSYLIRATEETLARDRTVLILAPEVTRAGAIAELARARWGNRVELFHSGLTPIRRGQVWRRIRTGAASIVVGTRSAVFAPLGSLGLICVEDEEDSSFKEEAEPRYHAHEVAWMRAGQDRAVLLLGSAHPSLETVQAIEAGGEALRIPGGGVVPPAIQVVDLRRFPHGSVLTEPMIAGIRAALEARAGVVLFLNRKGFAPALLCRDCGSAQRCPHCSVTLNFSKRATSMACHSCGASFPVPETCTFCLAARIEPVGFGTERVEEEVRRLFPGAKIGRLDRDIAPTARKADAIRHLASAGEFDILIGTQMLFQGSPLPPVGFVGLPHADAGLHLPDFRSAERTYHAILDAVAMACPGAAGGN
ncbi:MAG TPA: primosomal protein N', partial [Nitrospiraceae bacterium]|nr:primosomal protein N' [Nitrospiraceae bacterium]